jgi:2-phosphosulfolactate phosphatase
VRVHVAFTPAETTPVPTAIVIDALRATSTIVQALAAGYERVYCCAEVDEARALATKLSDAVTAGERNARLIPGFDLGNSPREFVEPRAAAVVLTTTNGTRAIVAAANDCEAVLLGSLLNLEAVAGVAARRGVDVEIVCAGMDGRFTIEDSYCAGRIAELLGGEPTEAAEAAIRLARSFESAEEAFGSGRSAANLRENGVAEDIAWCARANVADAVPRLASMRGSAAEIAGA